jgi:hypothetical protein
MRSIAMFVLRVPMDAVHHSKRQVPVSYPHLTQVLVIVRCVFVNVLVTYRLLFFVENGVFQQHQCYVTQLWHYRTVYWGEWYGPWCSLLSILLYNRSVQRSFDNKDEIHFRSDHCIHWSITHQIIFLLIF